MFRFDNPFFFILLSALPLFFILRYTGILQKVSFPLTLGDWGGSPFRWKSPFATFCKTLVVVLSIAGYCAAVAALAHPVVSRQEKVFTSRGAEIVFAIDISPSMAAMDMNGKRRIDAARTIIHTFVADNPGTAFALTALATDAALLVPPTLDHTVFLNRLDSLAIGEMGGGTALGTGLTSAVYHLAASSAPKKAVVLLTDGENNTGQIHPNLAAQLAAENGISLYIVGIGTRGTVPVEYTDTQTGKVYSGLLESSFNESSLRKIAEAGDGTYFSTSDIPALSAALADIGRRESVIQTFYYQTREEYVEGPFICAALLLFAGALCIKRLFLREIL